MWCLFVFHHGRWYLRHAIFGELSEQWKTLEEPWPLVEVVPGGSVQAMAHVSEVYLKIGWKICWWYKWVCNCRLCAKVSTWIWFMQFQKRLWDQINAMSYLSTIYNQGMLRDQWIWQLHFEPPRHLGRKQLRPLLREAGFLGDWKRFWKWFGLNVHRSERQLGSSLAITSSSMSHDDSDWICDMFQPSQYCKNKIELQVANWHT